MGAAWRQRRRRQQRRGGNGDGGNGDDGNGSSDDGGGGGVDGRGVACALRDQTRVSIHVRADGFHAHMWAGRGGRTFARVVDLAEEDGFPLVAVSPDPRRCGTWFKVAIVATSVASEAQLQRPRVHHR